MSYLFAIVLLLSQDSYSQTNPPRSGTLDTSFANQGRLTIKIGDSIDRINSINTLPDGRILAVGATRNRKIQDYAIVRLTPNGALDPTFNPSGTRPGIVVTRFANHHDIATDSTLLPNGGFFVIGRSHGYRFNLSLAKYLDNGALDPSFGNGGKFVSDAYYMNHDHGRKLVVLPNQSVIVAGSLLGGATPTKKHWFMLGKIGRTGKLDKSFANNGLIVVQTLHGVSTKSHDMIITPSNHIYLGGYGDDGSTQNFDFCLMRFLPNGKLDMSFGADGKVLTEIGQKHDVAWSMARQLDSGMEKILLGGYGHVNNSDDFAIARYLPDGSLDPTFGERGIVKTNAGAQDIGRKLLIHPLDGKILLGGYIQHSPQKSDFAVVRYLPNGVVDTTFGEGGVAKYAMGNGIDRAIGMAIQPDGKIILGGQVETGPSKAEMGIMRIHY